MKKDVLKLLSFILCFIVLLGVVSIGFATADNGVKLNVSFGREEYIVGETVTAKVYLTNVADEFNDSLILGGIGTNLCFSDNLEYVENSHNTSFNIGDGDLCDVALREVQEKNILSLQIADKDGLNLRDLHSSVEDSTEVGLVAVSFKVIEKGQISIKFEDEGLGDDNLAYETVVFDSGENKLDCTIESTSAVANIIAGEAIIRDEFAEYSGNEIVAYCNPYIVREEGAVLFVKLYDTTTNMIVAPVQILPLNQGKAWFDEPISFTYDGNKENIEVAYYIFDTTTSLKPICKFKSVELVEHQ